MIIGFLFIFFANTLTMSTCFELRHRNVSSGQYIAWNCVLTTFQSLEKRAKSHSSSDSAGSKVGAIYLKAFSTHELEKKEKKSSYSTLQVSNLVAGISYRRVLRY